MENKKKLALILSTLVMLSSFGAIGLAQENLDVVITAGDTAISDMTTLDDAPSSSLGGIVSAIESTFRRTVKLAGVDMWKDEVITQEQEFDLLLFAAGEVVDFDTLENVVAFETSETDVDVRGVIGTWTTSTIDSIVDGADLQPTPIINSLDSVTLSTGELVEYINGFWHIDSGGAETLTFAITGAEPTQQEIEDVYGAITGITGSDDLSTGHTVVQFVQGDLKFLVDLNNDGVWSLASDTVSGYTVAAQSGEVLGLIPADTYDIYGVLPVE